MKIKRKIKFADSDSKTETEKSVLFQGYEISVAVICFVMLVACLFAFYEYSDALTVIKTQSEKLRDVGDVKVVSITAKPFKINLGEKTPKDVVKNYLVKVGYIQAETGEAATFNESENILKVYSRFSEFPDLGIRFQKGKILSILDLKSNKNIFASELEPVVLNQYLPVANHEIGAIVHEQVDFERDVANTVFLDTLLTVENRNYFKEANGISWKSLARAFSELAICKGGKLVGYNCKLQQTGASTITAQTIKNLFLTNEQTFSRKYEEFWLTIALEKYLNSKIRILELYLNNVVISEAALKDSPKRQIVGFAAAAKYLYGKKLKELNVNEAISLSCLAKMPNKLLKRDENGNLVNYDRLLERRNKYLKALRELYPEKYSSEVIDQAISEDIKFKFDWQQEVLDKSSATFTAYAEKSAEDFLRTEKISFKSDIVQLQTDADTELLVSMHKVLRSQLPDFAGKLNGNSTDVKFSGSIVIYDPKKGKFLSINSLELENNEFHLSRHAFESTGQIMSLVKPFIVGYAMQKGKFRLSDKINPRNCYSAGWIPQERNLDVLTLGQHLVSSNNLVPLCVLKKVELNEFSDWWKALTGKESSMDFRIANGLTADANLSAVEVARLYGMFGYQGKLVNATPISAVSLGDKIIDPAQNEIQALDSETAKFLSDQLRSVTDDKTPDGNFGTAKTFMKEAGLSGKSYKIFAKTGSGPNDYWIALGNSRMIVVVRLTVQSKLNQLSDSQNIFAADTAAIVAKEVLKNILILRPQLLKD